MQGAEVLLAVSTGCDSMVMLDLMQKLPEKMRPSVSVAYVNHRLREQSEEETRFIAGYCRRLGIPLYVKVWEREDHPKRGIEEAARNMRYGFFEEVMKEHGIGFLFTAHHANDQAETVLMKAVRGGDLEQLTGISFARPFASGTLLRPLLHFSRAELREYAEESGLKWFEDETNENDDVLRNRIRHHVVPLLARENRQFLTHVGELSDQLADVLDYAEAKAAADCAGLGEGDGYSVERWRKMPESGRRLTLKHILKESGSFSLKKERQCLGMLEDRARPQGTLDLGNDWMFFITYGVFGVRRDCGRGENNSDKVLKLIPGKWYSLDDGSEIGVFRRGDVAILPDDDVLEVASPDGLSLRHRRTGDVMPTSCGTQKIRKILMDRRIPGAARKRLWLVADGQDRILWVIGVRKSDLSRSRADAKMQYVAVFRKKQDKERGFQVK